MENETELKKRNVLRMSNIESNLLTKECIQTALIQLLSESPFEKITVTSIIKRSGVSRAGFYRNYSSKEMVLQELTQNLCEKIETFLNNEDYHANPKQGFTHFFQEIKEQAYLLKLLTKAAVPHTVLLDTEHFFAEKYSNMPAKERYHIIALLASLKEVVLDWFKNDMKESPEEMADLFVTIFGGKFYG